MTSQRRVRIKTHAGLRVGIEAQNLGILPNKSQITDFRKKVQSGRFAGFSGGGKEEIGDRNGVILPLEEYCPDRILGVFVRRCCRCRSGVFHLIPETKLKMFNQKLFFVKESQNNPCNPGESGDKRP
jgi:hypothetical protein